MRQYISQPIVLARDHRTPALSHGIFGKKRSIQVLLECLAHNAAPCARNHDEEQFMLSTYNGHLRVHLRSMQRHASYIHARGTSFLPPAEHVC